MAEPAMSQARWKHLHLAVSVIPAGRWAVGVSGGADSVALLRLLSGRGDLALHVVHLDHQTRGEESRADAAFVSQLAIQLNLVSTIALRSDIEAYMRVLPKNPSARFRAVRMELFREVAAKNDLQGVILAHHADDQAETIFLRLLRGAGPGSLAGMRFRTNIGKLRVLRPLLGIRSSELREFLDEIAQPWREDSSNQSAKYLRNQVRMILAENPALHDVLLGLGAACRELSRWLNGNAARLPSEFASAALIDRPAPLARRSAARWLSQHGAPAERISVEVCERLIEMAMDAASPPRAHFPGGIWVRRRKGVISVEQGEGQTAATG